MAMFDLTIKPADAKWLSGNYPNLKIAKRADEIVEVTGRFVFSMAFKEGGEGYVLNPIPSADGIKIEDEYAIRIELQGSEFSDLPQVYETELRLKKVAEKKNIQLTDLHINPNGAACLCIKQEELFNIQNGFSFEDFFNNLLIPFFYAQSYFEKNNSWPFGEYAHGVWGFIEWYGQQQNPTCAVTEDLLKCLQKYRSEWVKIRVMLDPKHQVKGHHFCTCGKVEKMRNCHIDILNGLWKLKQDIIKFNLKV